MMNTEVATQAGLRMVLLADGPSTQPRRLRASIAAVVVFCPLFSACSSMTTLDIPEHELQSRIRAGELIQPGERVQLVTSDESEHELLVASVDDNAIHGDGELIPIEDVVAIKTRQFHAGNTALLAGGVVGVWTLVAIVIAPAAILAASAP